MEPVNLIKKPVRLSFVDNRLFYRFLELIPGLATWTVIIAPIILSVFYPVIVAYFIIAYDLFWLVKSMRMSGGRWVSVQVPSVVWPSAVLLKR